MEIVRRTLKAGRGRVNEDAAVQLAKFSIDQI